MNDVKEVMRIIESLALMVQSSAECGELDSYVYADMAELISGMTAHALSLLEGGVTV
jgi:hypothetical protein